LPVALDSGDADDFASAKREVDAVQVMSREHDLRVGPRFWRRRHPRRRLPTHHGARNLNRCAAPEQFGNGTSGAQHRDGIGDRGDFIDFVSHEHDRAAPVYHATQQDKQSVYFARGQQRGRLIEDQEARCPGGHHHDFGPLLFADGQRPDQPIGLERFAEPRRRFCEISPRAVAIDEPDHARD